MAGVDITCETRDVDPMEESFEESIPSEPEIKRIATKVDAHEKTLTEHANQLKAYTPRIEPEVVVHQATSPGESETSTQLWQIW